MSISIDKLQNNIITSIREALLEEGRILRELRTKRSADKDYPKIVDIGEVPLTYVIFKHLLKRRDLRSLIIIYQDYYPRRGEEMARRKYADITICLTRNKANWAYVECKKFGEMLIPQDITNDRDKLVEAIKEKENEDKVQIKYGYLLVLSADSGLQHIASKIEGLKWINGGRVRQENLSFGLFRVKT